MTETALVPHPEAPAPLVLPVVNADAMRHAMATYTSLCEAVLDPNDFQTIQNKRFKKRSAWQKLATAFSVTCQILDHKVHTDEQGRVVRAEFTVRATAPNGRSEDGYGACSARERQFTKPDHDIPATAETRARNRACANLFAFGELTAEEMQGVEGEATPEAARPRLRRQTTAAKPEAPAPAQSAPATAPRPIVRNPVVVTAAPAEVPIPAEVPTTQVPETLGNPATSAGADPFEPVGNNAQRIGEVMLKTKQLTDATVMLMAAREGLLNVTYEDEQRLKPLAQQALDKVAQGSYGRPLKDLAPTELDALLTRARAAGGHAA